VAGGLCSVWRATAALSTPVWSAPSLPGGNCAVGFTNWYLHYVHPDGHGFAFAPDRKTLYVVSDGGLSRTSDGGSSWVDLVDGVGAVQLYGICVDPADATHLYGGAQDNGSMRWDGSGVAGWRGLISGDGGPCIAAAQSGGMSHEVISDTDGEVMVPGSFSYDTTFNAYAGYCTPGTDPGCGDRVSFVAPLVGDPSAPSVLYVGTHRLWRSDQGGAAGGWSAVSDDLTAGVGGVACLDGKTRDDYLTAIAVAPSDGKTIYTGSSGGVLSRTRDGGATWSRLSDPALPARWVSALAVDASDPTRLYVAFSGFGADTPATPGHVFASSDAGASFRRADVPLDAPVNALSAHPVAHGLLYAGTDVGVLLTVDDGASWAPLDGLPGAAVYSLVFHERARALFAGTHGRGVWQKSFPGTLAAQPSPVALKVSYDEKAPPMANAQLAVGAADPSGSIVELSAASDQPWLAVSPASGRAAGTAQVQLALVASSAGLPPGEYDAHVALTDPAALNTPLSVPVHLSVVAPPGGCGCRLGARSSGPPIAALAALGMVLLAVRRRLFRRG
jgi:MYXO-CTERM domain-containing protein